MKDSSKLYKIFIAIMCIIIIILGIILIIPTDNTPIENSDEYTGYTENATLDLLKATVYEFLNSDVEVLIHTSIDTSEVIYRNANWESITGYNAGNVVIKNNKNTSVMYGQEIEVYKDIDLLDIVRFGVEAVYSDSIPTRSYSRNITEGSGSTTYQYVIDLYGYETLHKFYELSKIDGYADTIIDNIKKSSTNTTEMGIRIVYTVVGEQLKGFSLYSYNSNEPLKMNDDAWKETVRDWYFTDWNTTKSWELSDDWYHENFESLSDTNLNRLGKTVLESVNNALIE